MNYPQESQRQALGVSFKQVSGIVLQQLQEMDRVGQQQALMTAMDFMNDFATEEFLTKNIRVRPQSGPAHKEVETDAKSETNKNLFGVEAGDDEEKFSKMMMLEIQDQRRNIKTQKDEFFRRQQQEEEKARAKKGKDN